MKNIFKGIVVTFLFTFYLNAQDCELPEVYPGTVTGANMTIMLTQSFMHSLPTLEENAYVVVTSLSSQVFGSTYVDGNSQTSISVWGDDSYTEDVDGALANEQINLFLVSGDNLYQIMNHSSSIFYMTNSVNIVTDVSVNLIDCSIVPGCINDWAENYNPLANEDDGSCYLYGCLNTEAFNFDINVTHEDNSCLFDDSHVNKLSSQIDSLQDLSESYEDEIIDLSNQLSLAMQNQDDGVSQEDVDALEDQIDNLLIQIAEISDNSLNAQLVYFENQIDVDNPSQYNALLHAFSTINEAYAECNPNVYGRIPVTLNEGWNNIGYNLLYESNASNALLTILDKMIILKNNNGNIFWPQYNFNGVGLLIPGHGYQIRMDETVDEFYFE